MGKINSDQKLELIRSIRMQNQYNRNQCRERERFLYGYQPVQSRDQREIYSTEMAAAYNEKTEAVSAFPKDSSLFSSFRIRFVVAVVLIGAFIYMDKSDMTLFGKTMEEFASYISSTLNSFDL